MLIILPNTQWWGFQLSISSLFFPVPAGQSVPETDQWFLEPHLPQEGSAQTEGHLQINPLEVFFEGKSSRWRVFGVFCWLKAFFNKDSNMRQEPEGTVKQIWWITLRTSAESTSAKFTRLSSPSWSQSALSVKCFPSLLSPVWLVFLPKITLLILILQLVLGLYLPSFTICHIFHTVWVPGTFLDRLPPAARQGQENTNISGNTETCLGRDQKGNWGQSPRFEEGWDRKEEGGWKEKQSCCW